MTRIIVLNAPIGTVIYTEDFFTEMAPFQDIASLENAHAAFHHLKSCLGVSKVNLLLPVTLVCLHLFWSRTIADIMQASQRAS